MFCPFCEIVRSPSTRHCVICNRCVERYDHHCPWIDNCVGARNHGVFLGLLVSLVTEFAFGLLVSACGAYVLFSKELDCNIAPVLYDLLCSIDASKDARNIFGGTLVVLCLLLLFGFIFTLYPLRSGLHPISLLSFLHVTNFCFGRTTNERFGGNPNASMIRERRNCLGNCAVFCCNREVPRQAALYNQYAAIRSSSSGCSHQSAKEEEHYTEENLMDVTTNAALGAKGN